MEESIEKAKEELKRVDHLFFVSLKYTKTVDVIRSIIARLINSFEFAIDTSLLYMVKKKKIEEIPKDPINKAIEAKKLFKKNEQFCEDIDLYFMLRKLNRCEFDTEREFRKHVTMTAKLDDKRFGIKVDILEELFERGKDFVEKASELVYGKKDE